MLPPCSLTLLDNRTGFHIEGRGRPVVLLHSSLGSKGQWRALVERMRRSHRLIAIDLLLGYVRRHSYLPFVLYRLVLAALIVLVIVSGWRDASF